MSLSSRLKDPEAALEEIRSQAKENASSRVLQKKAVVDASVKGTTPLRIYILNREATYNTLGVGAQTTSRDACKMVAIKNGFGQFHGYFGILLWKAESGDHRFLLDSEKPARFIALWEQKGWNDQKRRLFFAFNDTAAPGVSLARLAQFSPDRPHGEAKKKMGIRSKAKFMARSIRLKHSRGLSSEKKEQQPAGTKQHRVRRKSSGASKKPSSATAVAAKPIRLTYLHGDESSPYATICEDLFGSSTEPVQKAPPRQAAIVAAAESSTAGRGSQEAVSSLNDVLAEAEALNASHEKADELDDIIDFTSHMADLAVDSTVNDATKRKEEEEDEWANFDEVLASMEMEAAGLDDDLDAIV